jgi:hypothetical protein
MQSENTYRLSEAEVEALLQGIRSEDLENITSEWPSSATRSAEHEQQEKPVNDPVNPNHYKKGEIEAIDAIKSMLTPEEWRGFLKGTAVAYLWRLGHKDAVEQDARKTQWYVSWLAGVDPRG